MRCCEREINIIIVFGLTKVGPLLIATTIAANAAACGVRNTALAIPMGRSLY
jgi:hypothetical protein